jgi:hypothetical protein
MQEKNKILHINEEEDYFEEFDQEGFLLLI